MDNWTPSLTVAATADHDEHIERLEKLLAGIFRYQTPGRGARECRSRLRPRSGIENGAVVVVVNGDEEGGERGQRDAGTGQGSLQWVVEDESPGKEGTVEEAQFGDAGPGIGEEWDAAESAGGQRLASFPHGSGSHSFQRHACAVGKGASEEDDFGRDGPLEDDHKQDGAGLSTATDPSAANALVMGKAVTKVMIGTLANFGIARLHLPEAIADVFAQKAMTDLVSSTLAYIAEGSKTGQRRARSSSRSGPGTRASKRRRWSDENVKERLATAEMGDIREEKPGVDDEPIEEGKLLGLQDVPLPESKAPLEATQEHQEQMYEWEPEAAVMDNGCFENPFSMLGEAIALREAQEVSEPGQEKYVQGESGHEDHKHRSHERGNQKSPELEHSGTDEAFFGEYRPSINLTGIALHIANLGDGGRPKLILGPSATAQETSEGDVSRQQSGPREDGVPNELKDAARHVTINNNEARLLWHPRPGARGIGTSHRTREKDVALKQTEYPDSPVEIRRRFREGLGCDLEMRSQQAERILDSPKHLVATLCFLPQLHGPAEPVNVLLLVSTMEFELANQHAYLLRRSGIEPYPGEEGMILADDGCSVVIKTSTQEARQVLMNYHCSYFTSTATGLTSLLRVMYVKPREGGEILVEGLTMPDGEAMMMWALVYFFPEYDM